MPDETGGIARENGAGSVKARLLKAMPAVDDANLLTQPENFISKPPGSSLAQDIVAT
jgi:hypothetical protein